MKVGDKVIIRKGLTILMTGIRNIEDFVGKETTITVIDEYFPHTKIKLDISAMYLWKAEWLIPVETNSIEPAHVETDWRNDYINYKSKE